MGRYCYLGFVGPFMCREGGWERSQLEAGGPSGR